MLAMAEGQLLCRLALDIKAFRVLPLSFVAIGGSEHDERTLALRQHHTVDLHFARNITGKDLNRRLEAEHFIHRCAVRRWECLPIPQRFAHVLIARERKPARRPEPHRGSEAAQFAVVGIRIEQDSV